MSGRIDEISYADLKKRKLSDQSKLSDFTDEEITYIAPVSLPRHGIERFVDEIYEDLGVPERRLKKFLSRRAGYRTNSAIDNPNDKAYEDLNISEVYRNYLKYSATADEQIEEIVERVTSNENVTLVCYEQEGKRCHRHILVDIIRGRVEERASQKFSLST